MPGRPSFFHRSHPFIVVRVGTSYNADATVGLLRNRYVGAGVARRSSIVQIKVFRVTVYLSGEFESLTVVGLRALSLRSINGFRIGSKRAQTAARKRWRASRVNGAIARMSRLTNRREMP